jgi:uncharacterized protein YacL
MKSRFTVRLLVASTLGSIVWVFIDAMPSHTNYVDLAGAGVAFLIGLVAIPLLFERQFGHFNRFLGDAPLDDLLIALLGIVMGVAIAALVAYPLSRLPYPAGVWLPVVALIAITALCTEVVLDRRADVKSRLAGVGHAGSLGPASEIASPPARQPVLLDTSAIIDGRIADISTTGFITGELVVPRFVLDELQRIADSPDVLRRNRGRRGLDMLNRMSKDSATPVSVLDVDAKDVPEVDGKLVQVAKKLSCPIITNDFNLNRVAELQGVTVLNINQLANAVKPVVLPGEEMAVHIIQQGKEINQGVGYLDDGTMIVVEDGQRYLNRDVEIVVTRVLQTVAGRMIFAHPKSYGNGR